MRISDWSSDVCSSDLRSHENMTQLIRYGTQLYSELEAETGLATGGKCCGSISVARTEERMTLRRRTAAMAQAYDVEAEVSAAATAGRRWPVRRTDDLVGAVGMPGGGKAKRTDQKQARTG